MEISQERLNRERKAYLEAKNTDPTGGHDWVDGYVGDRENGEPPVFLGYVELKIRRENEVHNTVHENRQKAIAQGIDVD